MVRGSPHTAMNLSMQLTLYTMIASSIQHQWVPLLLCAIVGFALITTGNDCDSPATREGGVKGDKSPSCSTPT